MAFGNDPVPSSRCIVLHNTRLKRVTLVYHTLINQKHPDDEINYFRLFAILDRSVS